MSNEPSVTDLLQRVPDEVNIYVSKGIKAANEFGIRQDQLGAFLAGYAQACATESLATIMLKLGANISDSLADINTSILTPR